MTDLIYDYITIGVDLLISAVIISTLVILLRITTILNTYTVNQQVSSERLNYYREFNKYDKASILTTSDVITAIMQYRHEMEIVILMKDATGNISIYTNYHNGKYNEDFYKKKGDIYEQISCEDFIKSSNLYLPVNTIFQSRLYESNRNPKGNISWDHNGLFSDDGYEGGVVSGLLFKYYGTIDSDNVTHTDPECSPVHG